MKYKWAAYDSVNGDTDTFETLNEAKEWLEDLQDFDEGIPEEVINGQSWIAKITHVTDYKITDKKSDYDDPEDWPYSNVFDHVGEVVLKEVPE